jgi:hypothetical protein
MVSSELNVGFAVERFMVSPIYHHFLLRRKSVEETVKVENVVVVLEVEVEEVVVITHVDNS